MHRMRSKYRIVIKTKAQVEREKRVKAKKALLEKQRAMDAGEIYSGAMMVLPLVPHAVVDLLNEVNKNKKVKPE